MNVFDEGSPVFLMTFQCLEVSDPVHCVKDTFMVPFACFGDQFSQSWKVPHQGTCCFDVSSYSALLALEDAFPCGEWENCGVVDSRISLEVDASMSICNAI